MLVLLCAASCALNDALCKLYGGHTQTITSGRRAVREAVLCCPQQLVTREKTLNPFPSNVEVERRSVTEDV